MRSRRSPWSVGLLAAGFALSLAAVGCGDDDTTESGGSGGSGGAAGKTGGTGGSAGKTGGTGGSAGKSGSGGTGGSVSSATCVTDTTNLMKGQSGGLSAECISCICEADAKSVEACNGVAECWQFFSCYDENHCTMANQMQCVTDNCLTQYQKATSQITPTATALTGSCSSKCAASDTDGGTADAGN